MFIFTVLFYVVTGEFQSQVGGQRDLDSLTKILERTLKKKDELEEVPVEKKAEKQEDGECFPQNSNIHAFGYVLCPLAKTDNDSQRHVGHMGFYRFM